jgi:hypothetical protein
MLVEVPTKNVIYIFQNNLSYMINETTLPAIVEVHNMLDSKFEMSWPWKCVNRYLSLISRQRIMKTMVQRKFEK